MDTNVPGKGPAVVDTDVLIVGYGPVGKVLAILLARLGHGVTVVERWSEPYRMPRAVTYDDEAARILALTGVADSLDDVIEPTRDYTFRNAQGLTLMHLTVPERGWCGWPESTSMYQPGLEAALDAKAAELPNLTVVRGHVVEELTDHGDHVELVAKGPGGERFGATGRWAVGCDGANSFVRSRIEPGFTDFGFSPDWLICDVVENEPREFTPNNLQICDPARPRTSVSAGYGHRRWEFMRLPGEPVEEFGSIETVWRLLGLFGIDRSNATLRRHAVYTVRARCADRWRSGRLLLAGDAVHVMPPFLGQGMCSGFRDAVNLTWKLDLVLAGLADARVLDSYTTERGAHTRSVIEASVDIGKVICETDPAAARGRDATMVKAFRAGRQQGQQRRVYLKLADGLLHRDDAGAPAAAAGDLTPQGMVARGPHTGRFDQVVGPGFALIGSEHPDDLLDADSAGFLKAIGTRLVRVLPAGTPAAGGSEHDVVDLDSVYLPYLERTGAVAVLVRPDFYLFGAAAGPAELTGLVADLRRQLTEPG
ncbi:bifunctional 3-(3-hydroxy-phenyl)propionate/3-hydroxycinnamic acid hydroxylase [Amycolatopsis sp. lyj-346]|uniref:bifunctional 3-(3-hydroxy-phenyl)propionate/3-hydroxycinnamic acid hydroxylase MhpA n=1 Tax=Amycolatopsis sp. lyj-346 TaxID=2789289 RepID=UPI0039798A2C